MFGRLSKAAKYSRTLSAINPELASTYRRAVRFSSGFGRGSTASNLPAIHLFRSDASGSDDLLDVFFKGIVKQRHGNLLDLESSTVLCPKIEDIELDESDKYAQVVLLSKDDISVRYGKPGIAASSKRRLEDLLEHELSFSAGAGVLNIGKHVPFLIKAKDPKRAMSFSLCSIEPFPSYEKMMAGYSLTKVIELPPETSRIISLRLQQAIFENKKNEYFYQKVTSRSYMPSILNKSSGTLMSFEHSDKKSTASHYHPGERSLYIFTTGKACGVKLNFCGVAENPDDRKDCEVKLDFEKNSLTVLNFPPYTHHKFYGEFVCMSIHPREGKNLIDALNSGSLPSGFLESATFFSNTGRGDNKWEISLPDSASKKAGISL